MSTPSTNSQVASPTIAKSWKSASALLDETLTFGSRDGRERTVAHRRGAVPEPLQHRVDIELVGHAFRSYG